MLKGVHLFSVNGTFTTEFNCLGFNLNSGFHLHTCLLSLLVTWEKKCIFLMPGSRGSRFSLPSFSARCVVTEAKQ